MNIAVVGGAGFIGTNVCKMLVNNGSRVVIVDKFVPNGLPSGTVPIRTDILSEQNLEEIFLNYEISSVIHLVGLPHIGDCEKNPFLSFQLNCLSTQHVVEAMRKTSVKKIVFASTAAVYGNARNVRIREIDELAPDTIYGFHKMISEDVIRSYHERYGLDSVILRLFNVYGNKNLGKDVLSIFIRNAIEHKPIIISGPKKFRDFVYIEDISKAFVEATTASISGKAMNIASGTKLMLEEIGQMIASTFPDTQVQHEFVPDDGTGSIADISLARELICFDPVDPHVGIMTYLRQFSGN
jgi:UDP-glucose 4-epimerase